MRRIDAVSLDRWASSMKRIFSSEDIRRNGMNFVVSMSPRFGGNEFAEPSKPQVATYATRDTLLQFRAASRRNILRRVALSTFAAFSQILKSVRSGNRGHFHFLCLLSDLLAAACRGRADVAHGNEIRLGEERVTRLVVNRNCDFNLFGWWRKPSSQCKCY